MNERKSPRAAGRLKTLSDLWPPWKVIRPFVHGGVATCIATACIQPVDMVKVRIQLQGEGLPSSVIDRNPISVTRSIIRNEGLGALYRGLSAALLRQAVYGTARLGLFRTLTLHFSDQDGSVGVLDRLCASVIAGGVGALLGTPADVALVRMQADHTLPPSQRRGYRNAFEALYRMAKDEGVMRGVFSGASPTIIRAVSVNVGMLASYDPAKEALGDHLGKNSWVAVVGAGIVSGVTGAVASLPFDFVKTRLQKQVPLPDGSLPYEGFVDCVRKVARSEGPWVFYNGLVTYSLRVSPHIVITWVTLEYLNSIRFFR